MVSHASFAIAGGSACGHLGDRAELEVVPTLTIVENVFLGAEPTRFRIVRWGDARRRL